MANVRREYLDIILMKRIKISALKADMTYHRGIITHY